MANRHITIVVFTLISIFLANTVHAQDGAETAAKVPDQAAAETVESDPAAWTRILEISEQAVNREGVTNSELDDIAEEAGRIGSAAEARAGELEPQAAELKQQLDELGEAPQTEQESDAVRDRRQELDSRFKTLDAQLREAKLNEITARQLQSRITKIRNDRFVSSLSARTSGLASPGFWLGFGKGIGNYVHSLRIVVNDSVAAFAERLGASPRVPFLLFLLLGLVGYAFLRSRRFLTETSASLAGDLNEAPMATAARILIDFLAFGALPAALVYAVYRTFSGLELLAPRFDQMLSGVSVILAYTIIAITLLGQFFGAREYRDSILHIQPKAKSRIYRLAFFMVIASAVLAIMGWTASALIAPLQVNIGISLLFSILVGSSVLWILYQYRKDRQFYKAGPQQTGLTSWIGRVFVVILWIAAVSIITSVLTGYIAFAEFLSQQVLLGTVIIMGGWLVLQAIDYLFLHLPAQHLMQATEQPDEVQSQQLASQALIVGSGISKMLVYVAGTVLMLLPWGYRSSDFFQLVKNIFFGVEIGGLNLSVATLLLVIMLFAIGYMVTVALRAWLRDKFLPTTKLDIGLSNSISTMFGYAGFILAAVLAVTAAGFELSNLAIVAGALSVGVGFGLQSIVNNFVSGLILLAERPIKAGDWVATSGGEGYVKKISVRSTEIETFDRATVIVPNSNLITDTVTNWTHGGTTGRIIVGVGVGYDNDPEKVEEILLECAKSHPKVLGKPAPAVYFMDFGASSLDFQLRCFLGDINYALSVSSELRFMIFKALGDADIDIPFPQRDVNLKLDTGQEALLATTTAPARRKKPPSK